MVRSKVPKVRDLVAQMRRAGWRPIRDSSSHQIWQGPNGTTITIVVKYQNDDVSRVVLTSVRRQIRRDEEKGR